MDRYFKTASLVCAVLLLVCAAVYAAGVGAGVCSHPDLATWERVTAAAMATVFLLAAAGLVILSYKEFKDGEW
jgi:protein-S-isoprenylcysteine O-methyltransferase Ste14